MDRMRILVTGASGFVGSALVPRLVREGDEVVAFGRDEGRLRAALGDGGAPHPGVRIVAGDALHGEQLRHALEGAEVAYYLIHSMEPSTDGPFPAREWRAVQRFTDLARGAGVRRAVYLGGLVPADAPPSTHLASRLAVEETLLSGLPDSVALRASIVIGARSRSFRFLVRLIERLPVLALPAWRDNRTAPIDARDVLAMLVAAADSTAAGGRSLDIGGPEVLSFGEMIERIAAHMLVARPILRLPLNATTIAAPVAAAVAGEVPELIAPLMAGLETDLLPGDDGAARLLGVRRHGFDAAVEAALRDWESRETLRAR
jgi:uncharacterized protein YbjT (DUF2867 family)